MFGKTPEQAIDAYVERTRSMLACISDAVVFSSGGPRDALKSLAFYSTGQNHPNRVRLRTHGGHGELILQIILRYRVAVRPNLSPRGPYAVIVEAYQYVILDRSDREIIAYHFDPRTAIGVRWPHLYASAALPITLDQPTGSSFADAKTYLAKLHLPTSQVDIEEIVRFLITDFMVEPLRPDWERVLQS